MIPRTALLLLLAAPLHAAPPDHLGRSILYTGTAADLASTRWALRHGAREATFAPSSLGGQIAVSAAYAAGIDLLAWKMSRQYPRGAHWTRVVFGAVKWGVALHNVRVARHQIRLGR